jgi:hypothetical protein
MEDKKLKKRQKKIPDADKNGDPIYKIDVTKIESIKDELARKDSRRVRAGRYYMPFKLTLTQK